jgi:hypothetical protein
MTGLEKGDLLIQVTALAGLTVTFIFASWFLTFVYTVFRMSTMFGIFKKYLEYIIVTL